jgi:DNA-binding GntR family transcriptional regulator
MTKVDKSGQTNSSIKRQEIVENLKSWIATLKPGQRLIEIHLCERFGVKRSMVREVLRQLEQDGFVKIIPHVGAIVTELSQKEIEHTYDLIGVLEGLAARVATPTIMAQHLEIIEALINKMQTAENASLFFDYNKEFHSFLTSLCENDRLIKFTENLRDHIRGFYLRGFYHPAQIQRANNEHRKIFEAIKKMKPSKVEMLVRDHYLRSKNRLIKYMNKSL